MVVNGVVVVVMVDGVDVVVVDGVVVVVVVVVVLVVVDLMFHQYFTYPCQQIQI